MISNSSPNLSRSPPMRKSHQFSETLRSILSIIFDLFSPYTQGAKKRPTAANRLPLAVRAAYLYIQ